MLSGLTGHLPEIIIVLVVILIIWGPGKLPDVGAAMGKGIREFRKAERGPRSGRIALAIARRWATVEKGVGRAHTTECHARVLPGFHG